MAVQLACPGCALRFGNLLQINRPLLSCELAVGLALLRLQVGSLVEWRARLHRRCGLRLRIQHRHLRALGQEALQECSLVLGLLRLDRDLARRPRRSQLPSVRITALIRCHMYQALVVSSALPPLYLHLSISVSIPLHLLLATGFLLDCLPHAASDHDGIVSFILLQATDRVVLVSALAEPEVVRGLLNFIDRGLLLA